MKRHVLSSLLLAVVALPQSAAGASYSLHDGFGAGWAYGYASEVTAGHEEWLGRMFDIRFTFLLRDWDDETGATFGFMGGLGPEEYWCRNEAEESCFLSVESHMAGLPDGGWIALTLTGFDVNYGNGAVMLRFTPHEFTAWFEDPGTAQRWIVSGPVANSNVFMAPEPRTASYALIVLLLPAAAHLRNSWHRQQSRARRPRGPANPSGQ